MALPYRTTGSLEPTFVPARPVSLAVKHPFALIRIARCPTALRVPSYSSVTLWEETAPVKLPTMHCPHPRLEDQVRAPSISGWYFKVGSTPASARVSKPPTYPTQKRSKSSAKL